MGLRYADLMQVKKHNFFHNHDGDYYYKTYNQKTQTEIIIPILPIVLQILQKYDFEVPIMHNAVFNKELKNILTFYKLFEEPVIKQQKVDGTIKEKQYLKRQLISSHTCRRSFVTNSLQMGVNLSNLMSATGHK